MIWFKINNRYYIDLMQIREFGRPKANPDVIEITFKDGKEQCYIVDDQNETFNRLAEAVNMYFGPMKVLDPPYAVTDTLGLGGASIG